MLINPLMVTEDDEVYEKNYETDTDKVIGEIITYLIANYSEYLSDININKRIVENLVREKVYKEYSNMNTESTIDAILNRLFGYHVLQKFIDDKEITDIRVTKYDNVFIKRSGIWQKTTTRFSNETDYINFVRYCVLKNGGKISNETPIVTCSDRKNNLRIEAGIEPVNVNAPSLVIRIHRPNGISCIDDLSSDRIEMINNEIKEFLQKAMISGCNIVISGKGGSGKTTLMRNLINIIPEDLSITSCEETAELYSSHPNIIQREIINNREKEKNITLADLTAHALVMSNDCIVVGELKGEEAMVFFDAVSTGHRGYATVHSDSSKSTLDRLVTLMKRDIKAQMYTDKYLRKLLSNSLDIIIYMNNFKVQEITEVLYDKETDDIIYNSLFEFKIDKIEKGKSKGKFKKVGKPVGRIKEKFEVYKKEIERILNNGNAC
ncbi:MAG: CpaF family protein [Clostridia bacterium]|nr:CpaF family protein [Clostridia bacterium]